MNIMYLSAEVEPFAKSGGLGDVLGALPKAVARQGANVSVVMPKYTRLIDAGYQEAMNYIGYMYVDLSWRHQYCGVFTLEKDNVTYYFLDNEFYFGGDLYCFADTERFAFFSKACLDLIGYLNKKVDILHCNDWSTALVPVMLDAFYKQNKLYSDIKTVYTIHNLRYQGKTSAENLMDLTALPQRYFYGNALEHGGCMNMMKGAIVYSDAVTTVSETYAREIRTDSFSECLGDVINQYSYKITGIVNGVDYNTYNPAKDKLIYCTYSSVTATEGKKFNKTELQKQLGLPVREDVAMIGLISRLVDQKGLDLIAAVMNDILQNDVQFVVLGTGESRYEEMFRYFASVYPQKLSANIYFSNQLAHRIYAASDFVLVPSLFEPCGLTQLIGLKYGSLPIVRETGGLKDTVLSYNEYTGKGNGFSFAQYNAHDMLYTINRALSYKYEHNDIYCKIQRRGMRCDYSWKESSKKYMALYKSLTGADS